MTSRKELLYKMCKASEMCQYAKWEAYKTDDTVSFSEAMEEALKFEDEMFELRLVADVLGVERDEMDEAMLLGIDKAYENRANEATVA